MQLMRPQLFPPDLTLLEVVLYDGDEVLRVDDALEGRAADDGLVGEDLDGAGAGGGGLQRQGGRRGAIARLLQELGGIRVVKLNCKLQNVGTANAKQTDVKLLWEGATTSRTHTYKCSDNRNGLLEISLAHK